MSVNRQIRKVARVCWNSNFWQGPTGRVGKSTNKDAFESEHGFGHEEWIFNVTKLWGGWKYGFLQAFNGKNRKYSEAPISLLLYTINDRSRARYWIGELRNVEVLTPEASRKALVEARKSGLVRSMRDQVRAIGLDPKTLSDAEALELFNIRYRPSDIKVFDEPIQFPPDSLASAYYGTLLDVPQDQVDIVGGDADAEGLRDRNINVVQAKRRTYASEGTVDLVHKQWQQRWRKELPVLLPGCVVRVETMLSGRSVDLLVEKGDVRILFELKTTSVVRQAIREALSQLLEYAYWPPAGKRIDAIVVVGAGESAANDQTYVQQLRDRFCLPLFYLQCKEGSIIGLSALVDQIASSSTSPASRLVEA